MIVLMKKCHRCGVMNGYNDPVCKSCSAPLDFVKKAYFNVFKKCPQCGNHNPTHLTKCSDCSSDISSVAESYEQLPEQIKSSSSEADANIPFSPLPSLPSSSVSHAGTRLSVILAVVVGVLGFIGGIVCGNMFPVVEGIYYPIEEFNTVLMLTIWIGTVFSVFTLVLMYHHFKNQEITNEFLEKISKNITKK